MSALLLLPASAALICASLLALLVRVGHRIAVDVPNARSLHAAPVPRIGGIALLTAAVPALLLAGVEPIVPGLAAVLAIVSFLDDRRGLPIAGRFAAHFSASAALVVAHVAGGASAWWFALVPAVVWMTNLYNFMDGSDGLAGGMAVAGFGTYAWAAAGSDPGFAAGCASVAAAAAAFLLFNFHPARVFMGDAGSVPLGFLAAALGLGGWWRGFWPPWFPVLAFAPFVADATVTLLRRVIRRERFWEPHRTHYYQRLVQLGWGHRRTALAAYALMGASSLAALAVREAAPAPAGTVLATVAVVYVVIAWRIDRAWRARARSPGA